MYKYVAAIVCTFSFVLNIKGMEEENNWLIPKYESNFIKDVAKHIGNYGLWFAENIDLTKEDCLEVELNIINEHPELCAKVLEKYKDILHLGPSEEDEKTGKKGLSFGKMPKKTLMDIAIAGKYDIIVEKLLPYKCLINHAQIDFFDSLESLFERNQDLFTSFMKENAQPVSYWIVEDNSNIHNAFEVAFKKGNDAFLSSFLTFVKKPSVEEFDGWNSLGKLYYKHPDKFKKVVACLSSFVSPEKFISAFTQYHKEIACLFWKDARDKENQAYRLSYLLNYIFFAFDLETAEKCLVNAEFTDEELESEVREIGLLDKGQVISGDEKILPASRLAILNYEFKQHLDYKSKNSNKIIVKLSNISKKIVKNLKEKSNEIPEKEAEEVGDELKTVAEYLERDRKMLWIVQKIELLEKYKKIGKEKAHSELKWDGEC